MENQQYFQFYNYITNQQIPENFNQQQIQQLKRRARHFIIQNQLLFKTDKNNSTKFYRVIRKEELPALLYMMHNDPTSGHFATEAMYHKIKTRYYWPQFYNDIREYVKSCDACQRRGGAHKNNLLHPIPVHSPFYQIGIDIVGPLPRTQRGKRYIMVAMDYLTKWPEARPLTEATAEKVAEFIYEQIICQHGCPQIILSDRGTHFNNKVVERLMRKFTINHLLSTPYHPQTNGLVERFNRTLCESLAKLSLTNNDWDLYIAPTLFAYRTTKHSTTKIEPFFLVYGRSARLPVDLPETTEQLAETNHIADLIDNVPLKRQIAQKNVTVSQHKQKERHDRKMKRATNYQIGDKVLYFRVALDQSHSGKFNPKWEGPYYIYEVLPHGAYKLAAIEGRILKTPINGNLLKPYQNPIYSINIAP